jgi:hypothetical protein
MLFKQITSHFNDGLRLPSRRLAGYRGLVVNSRERVAAARARVGQRVAQMDMALAQMDMALALA